MAMEGLLAVACASCLVAANPPASIPAPPGNDATGGSITATLAVQTAMQQGRDYLLHNNPKAAIEVLERQLPLINGNQNYLALLRDAYKTYIKELQLNKQDAAAQVYLEHLSILEPRASRVGTHGSAPVSASPTASALPKPTFRLYRPEGEEVMRLAGNEKLKPGRDLLVMAELEFDNRRFREASLLYEQAQQATQPMTDTSRQRWAYCKLHQVVEQLNQQSSSYSNMENEVRTALNLAPQLDYGKLLLAEIDRRRAESGDSGRDEAETVEVAFRELGRNADGWDVAETANFRIFHNQPREIVQQAAQVAERTRAAMQRKWFGRTAEAWNPKCDLFLHTTAQDYSRVTGAPGQSPGHSSFRIESGQVVGRRIDLHCDDINMLVAVLPHETTHTVVAGNFGEQPVPRWADEGMAVLTEPREKIERHLRNLPKYRDERALFSMRQLLQMNDYPDPRYVGSFYAESVSVVEFLSARKGPEVFTAFVRDGLRNGYEWSLQKHYGYRDFSELEQQWGQYAFNAAHAPTGVAQGNR